MPLVNINMMQGRPQEKLEEMASAVAIAIADTLDAPIGTVRIMINEMQPHQYSIGGKSMSTVLAERAAAEGND
ncbi:MAG: tautomerase family protein [Acidimicrobiia bacterium]|nr:tautomerase family protein [Acidimicrobiia bacterium]